ncbi:hypothetical protein [Xenorhabdus sp. PB62.4]|uniref:hypothetical protein n=1 Tax=Xenorhabdus sp. PB62.4 TaxID=1851573 RepID=UPI00165759D9|nr:hypothetical protein [Xenorhabdus sp. PB62.4]MBC8954974.1 hypothetical protein [Xenorhabdus sp. PB62.4]
MINKKVSILAGLFLSLVAGTSMAAETKSADVGGIVNPSNFGCTKLMTSGDYIGKLAYTVSLDSLVTNFYWFVSLESNDIGCVAVNSNNARHVKIAHEAFTEGKIVKIKLDGYFIKALVY